MGVGHQRRLHRESWQSRSQNRRKPHPKQTNPTYPAHPTPYGGPATQLCAPRPAIRSTIRTLRCTSNQLRAGRTVFQNNTDNWEHLRFRLSALKTQASSAATSVSSQIPTRQPSHKVAYTSHATRIPYSVKVTTNEEGHERYEHESSSEAQPARPTPTPRQ